VCQSIGRDRTDKTRRYVLADEPAEHEGVHGHGSRGAGRCARQAPGPERPPVRLEAEGGGVDDVEVELDSADLVRAGGNPPEGRTVSVCWEAVLGSGERPRTR
jgi:hypothetical protein